MEEETRRKRFEDCRIRFMEEVNPKELIQYLTCLTKSLEEEVLYWHDREGARHAAFRLAMELVKKDDWYHDVIHALRKINNNSLADAIEGKQDGSGARESRRNIEELIRQGSQHKNDSDALNMSPLSQKELELRSYQLELAKPALPGPNGSKNTIIVAPTGSGKTIVALKVALDFLDSPRNTGRASGGALPRKVVFLVNKRVLVEQQSELFMNYMASNAVIGLSGESVHGPLKPILEAKSVLVMTAMDLLNGLQDHTVALSQIGLLILDECHNCQGNTPYNKIMADYRDMKLSSKHPRPQILGMTASLDVGQANSDYQAESKVLQLCANLDAEVISTVHSKDCLEELSQHQYIPTEKISEVKGRPNDRFAEEINIIMEKIENVVECSEEWKKLQAHNPQLKIPSSRGNQTYEQWVVQMQDGIAVTVKATDDKNTRRHKLMACTDHLKVYNDSLNLNRDIRTVDALSHLSEFMVEINKHKDDWNKLTDEERQTKVNPIDETDEFLLKLFNDRKAKLEAISVHPNSRNPVLEKLGDVLLKTFETTKEVPVKRGILFTKTRASTEALEKWIEETEQLKWLKPGKLIGGGGSGGMSQHQQNDLLAAFREGDHKLIVATSVAQEGLDISSCNVIVKYNYINSMVEHVQLKGRNRAKGGQFFLVVDEQLKLKNKDLMNRIREQMMLRATNTIQKRLTQEKDLFLGKIKELQKTDQVDRRRKQRVKLNCQKCGVFACYSDDIRSVKGAHYIVITDEFHQLYDTKENARFPKKVDDFDLQKNIVCKDCKSEWGILGLYKGTTMPLLKIAGFIVEYHDGRQQRIKKWKDVLFKVDPTTAEDLKNIGTPAEILARGPEALKAYQKASEEGTKHVYRTRLMLVGQERVGKTSLMKSFTGQRFSAYEEITDGVDASTFVQVPKDKEGQWRVNKTDLAKHVENQHNDAVSALMVQDLRRREDRLDISEKSKHRTDVDTDENTQKQECPDSDQTNTSLAEESKSKQSEASKDRVGNEVLANEKTLEHVTSTTEKFPDGDQTEKIMEVPETISKIVAQGLQKNQDHSTDHKGVPEFHIWDFAGQDAYYTTHQVFLNHRAIYILVFDLSLDLSQPVKVQIRNIDKIESRYHELTGLEFLDFWMQSIYAYASTNQQPRDENKLRLSPPIFIVGTHRDSSHISTDLQERKRSILEKFKSIGDMISDKPYKEHVVVQLYAVENSSNNQADIELSSLMEDIVTVAGEEPYMGEKIPLKWLTFEKSVAEAIKKGKHFMELKEVQDMSKGFGIEADTLFTMLTFYHDLGTIIYFGGKDDTNNDLHNIVILDPQWLIDIFKKIITVLPIRKQEPTMKKMWRKLEKKGVLKDALINHVWSDLLPQKKALIALMEMFDLLCPRGAEGEVADAYYVPACLKPFPGEKMHLELTGRSDITFYIDFKGFLPDGFFHRLLVRAARWSQNEGKPKLFYRYGQFYLHDDHIVELKMQTTKPICIRVTVSKTLDGTTTSSDAPPDPKTCSAVTNFLENALKELTKTWIHGMKYEFTIACPCNTVPSLSHLLPLKQILSKPTIICREKYVRVETGIYQAWFQGGMTCTTSKQGSAARVSVTLEEPKELHTRHSRSAQPIYTNTLFRKLPARVNKVLERLNIPMENNWKELASSIEPDLTIEEMTRIANTPNPTQEVCNIWQQNEEVTLQVLLEHLYDMGRMDIVTDLQDQLNISWTPAVGLADARTHPFLSARNVNKFESAIDTQTENSNAAGALENISDILEARKAEPEDSISIPSSDSRNIGSTAEFSSSPAIQRKNKQLETEETKSVAKGRKIATESSKASLEVNARNTQPVSISSKLCRSSPSAEEGAASSTEKTRFMSTSFIDHRGGIVALPELNVELKVPEDALTENTRISLTVDLLQPHPL
ncbi:uncharacterized protein [Amphiura filiformis]|uniref:uncharacterized protein n=1 Tax=Amphiura filiformis TaxID=82378 RepID=UPI003B213136